MREKVLRCFLFYSDSTIQSSVFPNCQSFPAIFPYRCHFCRSYSQKQKQSGQPTETNIVSFLIHAVFLSAFFFFVPRVIPLLLILLSSLFPMAGQPILQIVRKGCVYRYRLIGKWMVKRNLRTMQSLALHLKCPASSIQIISQKRIANVGKMNSDLMCSASMQPYF